ncbi:bifunctional metallophosphatase/5'-nucleotidase [Actinomyces sp. S4-C9]|uniref:bifunctional metallophosphatase/5'-nucleotidase n=1 Tax=Actinomyces sp. S4-C9 TaxID=1219581 RepID=UPI00068D4755|nr:bifunctional UDP-sugar hydrolase/5'-nucleotidase [Actinomyces sp. S4-C9]
MRRSAKTLVAGAIATAALVVSPLAAFAEDPVSESGGGAEGDVVTMNLFNMTDIHGHIEKSEYKGKVTEAGLASTACYVKNAWEANNNSVFTLLGDNIGASPFTSGSQDDNPTIEALNHSIVFASAIGNHEFDKGLDVLMKRVEGKDGYTQIGFPYLAANIVSKATGETLFDPFKIWESPSGVKVGFIAAIEEDAPTKVAPGTFDEVNFLPAAETVNKYAAILKDGQEGNGEADIVVALYDNDVLISAPRLSSDVDILMGGDTHKPYYFSGDKALTNKDGKPIVATTASGSFTDNLANVEVKYDKVEKKIVEAEAVQIPASDLVACGEDADVKGVVDEAVTKAKEAKEKVVLETDSAFYRGKQGSGENRGTESTLGSIVADAMKGSFTKLDGKPIDIGIINAGGLRADLVPKDGKLTVGDVFAVAPFSNEVGYVEMTGAQFKTLLEQQWKEIGENSTRPMLKLGLSENVKYTYDPARPMGDRITSILLDGQPIDPQATYSVGSVTFLLAGGDSFDVLKEDSIKATLTTIPDGLDREWIQKYLEDNPKVAPRAAVSSVGATLTQSEESVDGKPVVSGTLALRGLSFSGPGEAAPKNVTLYVDGKNVATGAVNNTLEDANAANANAIVTADGVGYTDAPIEFSVTGVCEDRSGTVNLPLTVKAGTADEQSADTPELISEASGLTLTVDCGPAAEEPGEGMVLTPAAPEFINPSASDPASCTVKPYATVKDMEGVKYTVTVDGKELKANAEGKFVYPYGKTIIVKAEPVGGFTFAPNAKTEWSWTAMMNDKCNTGVNKPLAKTGVSMFGTAAGALALLLAGGTMLALRRKQA